MHKGRGGRFHDYQLANMEDHAKKVKIEAPETGQNTSFERSHDNLVRQKHKKPKKDYSTLKTSKSMVIEGGEEDMAALV